MMPELRGGEGIPDHEHARECAACAALLERQRALVKGLKAYAAESHRIEAPPRLEARLASAFRSYNGLRRAGRSRSWPAVLTWAAAAAAVLVLALFLMHGRQPRPEPAQQHKSRARIELASLQFPAGYEDGFMPLPNAPRLDADEDFDLVRVELPRSTLIALGYSLSPEASAELVEAEVMVGADGMARAVRFLDE